MQSTADPRLSQPLFIRASRITLERIPLMEHPLDEGIEYKPFIWDKKNPTLWDYLTYLPNNLIHFLNNLSTAFGWKFVFMVCVVYGLQQGLGNAWFFQARDYYLKDIMNLEPAEAQVNIAAAYTPWNIKPLYGMGSDTLFINGYQRTPYILFAGTVGTVCYLILSSVATIILPLVVILLFGVYFSTATPDVMIDASIADKCKLYPKFASDLQALCFGSFALFSIVGFGTSGIMIQAGGARLTFGILVATALPVFLFGSLGFFGEKRHEGDATHTTQSPSFISEAGASHSNSAPHNMNSSLLPVSNSKSWQLFRVNSDNWRMYKKIFLLAIFMSIAACSLSVVVLATKNWSIRFSAVFFVSIMVCLSVYFSNRKDLPQVANVALFIFLRESCNADLGTAMFYWYTDAKDGPQFSPVYIGIINMIGYFSMFLAVAIFNKYMSKWQYRYTLTVTQIAVCFVGLIDIIIVSRWNTQVGIPDAAMLIGDLTLYPMVRRLILLPLLILAAKVCPDGAEATIFSMLVSLNNLGATVSIYNGSFLLITFGVNEDNYDNFVWVILIKSLCRLLPILLIPFLIPIGAPQEEDDDKEDVEHNYDDSIMTSIIPEEIEIGSIRSSNIILPESLNQKFAQHRQSDHSATQRSYVIRPRRKYKRQSLIY